MYAVLYEDLETAPVSQALKCLEDGTVKMCFSGGANNLLEILCRYLNAEKVVIYYDLPPNNTVVCKYYSTLVRKVIELHKNAYVIPVLCTEYAVLKSLISAKDFKQAVYQQLYMCLVEDFKWNEAVKLMYRTNMMKNGKPKSLEKVYKELLANVKYSCLHNKGQLGLIYQTGCVGCKRIETVNEWEFCNYSLKGITQKEVGMRIYTNFPVFIKTMVTEQYCEEYSYTYESICLDNAVKEQIHQYRKMCNVMGVVPLV